MKKLFALLVLLSVTNTLKSVKIELFEDVNWQEVLATTITQEHISQNDRMAWVTTALVHGADITVRDYAPVREAVRRGHLCLLVVFIEAGLSANMLIDGQTIINHLLNNISRTGYPDIHTRCYIHSLINMHNSRSPYQYKLCLDYVYQTYRNTERFQDQMLLITKTALSKGIRAIDYLSDFILWDLYRVLEYLLDIKAITPATRIVRETVNSRTCDTSILSWAISNNAHQTVRLLLSRGAQLIRYQENRDSSLVLNVIAQQLHQDPHELIGHLLDYGVIDPNYYFSTNSFGFFWENVPLLLYCARFNAARSIRLLLSRGVDCAPDRLHNTALGVAVDKRNLEALQALVESGAYGLTPTNKLPCKYMVDLHPAIESYMANLKKTRLLLQAYFRRDLLAYLLPEITDCLYENYPQYYDGRHLLARLIIEYSQMIPIQEYKAPKPVPVTTLVHVPDQTHQVARRSRKRRHHEITYQPDDNAGTAATAHLLANIS